VRANLRAALGKLKLRNEVIVRQERAVEQQRREMGTLQESHRRLGAQLASGTGEAATLGAQLEESRKEAAEKARQLKNSENVITWLNRQLTAIKVAQAADEKARGTFMRGPSEPTRVALAPRSQNALLGLSTEPSLSKGVGGQPPSLSPSVQVLYGAKVAPQPTAPPRNSASVQKVAGGGGGGGDATGFEKYLAPQSRGGSNGTADPDGWGKSRIPQRVAAEHAQPQPVSFTREQGRSVYDLI
jgi:hypothetical protein